MKNRQGTVTDSSGLVTAYVYDEVGNATEVQHSNGTISSTIFDTLNRPTSVRTEDLSGLVLTQFDLQGYALKTAFFARKSLQRQVYPSQNLKKRPAFSFGGEGETHP